MMDVGVESTMFQVGQATQRSQTRNCSFSIVSVGYTTEQRSPGEFDAETNSFSKTFLTHCEGQSALLALHCL